MRYRLSTLVVVTALGPPLLAAAYSLLRIDLLGVVLPTLDVLLAAVLIGVTMAVVLRALGF